MIVDDHPTIREGLALRISLEPDMNLCGQADDTVEALRVAEKCNPDVAVVDLTLKTGNGLDLIKRLKERHNDLRITVWTMHSEDLYGVRVLKAGALGYVNKAESTDRLIEAIRQVSQYKVFVSRSFADALVGRSFGLPTSSPCGFSIDVLSDRELEVFQMLGDELDTKQIAQRLKLSPRTVETYCCRIKEKLSLHSARELLSRAIQWRLQTVQA